MKRAIVYSLPVLAIALSVGCGAGARDGVPVATGQPPTPPPQGNGHLVVGIRLAGGQADAGDTLGGGLVSIFNGHHHLVRRLKIRPGHTGRVRLPPGRYSVGLGSQWPTKRRLQGCSPEVATVRRGRTTRYTLYHGCWLM